MKPLFPNQPVTQRGDAPSRELVEIIQRLVDEVEKLKPARLVFHGDASANVTLTNQVSGDQFLGNSNRNIQGFDLGRFSEVRFSARVVTASASANTPRIILKYANTFTTTVGSFSDIGASAVSVSLSATGIISTGWVALASGAIGDGKFLTVVQTGGDGVADPALGPIWAEFR